MLSCRQKVVAITREVSLQQVFFFLIYFYFYFQYSKQRNISTSQRVQAQSFFWGLDWVQFHLELDR
jgi:hypothetical protein